MAPTNLSLSHSKEKWDQEELLLPDVTRFRKTHRTVDDSTDEEIRQRKIERSRIKTERAERSNNLFQCQNRSCKATIQIRTPEAGTSHRNHCPCCLTSKHVDLKNPGDRKSPCGGLMPAVAVAIKRNDELCLVHKCNNCHKINYNRIAGDDSNSKILDILETLSHSDVAILSTQVPSHVTILTAEDKSDVLKMLGLDEC